MSIKSLNQIPLFAAHLATSVIFTLAGAAHAQFGGLSGEIPAGEAVYFDEDIQDSEQATIEQFNTQGQQGRRFLAPYFFGGEPEARQFVNIFIGDEDDPAARFTYRSEPSPATVQAADDQLNQLGRSGFEFVAPLSVGGFPGEQFNLFIQREGSAQTFEYLLDSQEDSQPAFEDQIEARGAQGWEFISGIAIGETFEQRALYVRRTVAPGRFTFLLLDAPQDRDANLQQINTQGAGGYRWIGPQSFSNAIDIKNLFVRNLDTAFSYAYLTAAPQDTRDGFVSQANTLGDSGAYFKSNFILGTDFSEIDAVYVTRNVGITTVPTGSGDVGVNRSGRVTYTPSADGRYDLESSTDLLSWSPFGVEQDSVAGDLIIWEIGFTSVGSRRFYRVIAISLSP